MSVNGKLDVLYARPTDGRPRLVVYLDSVCDSCDLPCTSLNLDLCAEKIRVAIDDLVWDVLVSVVLGSESTEEVTP